MLNIMWQVTCAWDFITILTEQATDMLCKGWQEVF